MRSRNCSDASRLSSAGADPFFSATFPASSHHLRRRHVVVRIPVTWRDARHSEIAYTGDTMTSEASTFPPVTPELLDDVVQRILDVGSPRRIVLFGSRARGDAHRNSDLDLLIIEDSELPRYRRPPRYLRALVGVFPAKDIVVWTPAEVNAWRDVPNAFITSALREGRTLYER